MPSLEARLARNEIMFRSVNDRIRELAERFEHLGDDEIDFVCECADETCAARIQLTKAQYDDVREVPDRFVVTPGHEATQLVERVVLRTAAFVIVQKVGIAGDLARELSSE